MAFELSKRYIRDFKGNKVVLAGYLAYLAWMILTYPIRKIFYMIDLPGRRYKRMTQGKEEILTEVLGSKMIFPVADKGLSKEILLYGIREKNAVEVMIKELKEGMVVVDAGANLGYYALLEAKKAKKVYAIEPNPSAFEYLKKNVKLNDYKNVQLLNLCVGDKKGEISFVLDKNWNLSRVAMNGEKNTKKIKINTLDNLFRNKKIDLIRMDVEGYELNILKGAEKLIQSNPQIKIFLEFHSDMFPPAKREEFIQFCKRNGLIIKYFIDKKEKVKKPYTENFSRVRNAGLTVYHIFLEKAKMN